MVASSAGAILPVMLAVPWPPSDMVGTADVPRSSWNFSRVRNAPKSTEPSLLNGVISATNEPVSIFPDIAVSIPEFATLNPIDRHDDSKAIPSRSAGIYTIPRRCRLRRFAATRARLAFCPRAKLDILWPLLRRKAMRVLRVLIAMALAGAMMGCGQGQGPKGGPGPPGPPGPKG